MNHKKRRWHPAASHRPDKSKPAQPPKRGHRDAPGVWLYGIHTVLAALANPNRACLRLLLSPEAAQALEAPIAAIGRERPGLPQAEIVPRETLASRVGNEAVHQGIALLAGPPIERDLSDVCRAASLKEAASVVVLDQVEDPRNVGAVMRSAAAFGALAVIVTERHAPQQTGALAKAASGALETVPLVRVTNLVRALAELKEAGFWAAGLDAAAELTLDRAQFAPKTVLVLGAEGKGLRRLTRESCDILVRIPMAQAGASLNVSNAAAIALYAVAAAAPARRS
jgi:23S rRNA (guanosine2251-2'-O)-methyltransferase